MSKKILFLIVSVSSIMISGCGSDGLSIRGSAPTSATVASAANVFINCSATAEGLPPQLLTAALLDGACSQNDLVLIDNAMVCMENEDFCGAIANAFAATDDDVRELLFIKLKFINDKCNVMVNGISPTCRAVRENF